VLAHVRGGCAHGGERAAQVDVDDQVEVFVGHLPQHGVAQDSRVGHDDVEAAQVLHGRADELVRRLRGSHGRDHGDGATARLLDGLLGRRGRIGVDVVHDDGRTAAGELLRIGETESSTRSGDDGDFAVELHGGTP